MKYLVVLLGLFFTFQKIQAQTIRGKVVDSTMNGPINFADVRLFKIKNQQTPLFITSTDSLGNFQIASKDSGTFLLKIAAVGYRTMNNTIHIHHGNNDLTPILMGADNQLSGVVVTSTAKLVQNKMDKIVYNVEKDLTSQGGMATDVLKKVPMVSVDPDGNVDLLGQSNIKFLINGKNSSMFGSNVADALQTIPASQIKSIEVISSPGAKYDGEGTGGIINIILKDDKMQGINGNVSIGAGTRLQNGAFNLNMRKGKFGANVFFSSNNQRRVTTKIHNVRNSWDSTTQTNTALSQAGNGTFKKFGYQTGMGWNWDLSANDVLTGGFGYKHQVRTNTSNYDQENVVTNWNSNDLVSQTGSYYRSYNNHIRNTVDWNVDYKHNFKRDGQTLEFIYNASNASDQLDYYNNRYADANATSFTGTLSNNNGHDNLSEFSLDYVQPLGGTFKLLTGGKAAFRNLRSATDVYGTDADISDNQLNTALSNHLTYHQKVYAGYASLNFSLGSWLNVESGMRIEQTNIDATYSNASNYSIPNYHTWLPSMTIEHPFDNDKQSIKISVSRRIQRPDYKFLNPSIDATDSYNLSSGNPYLKPEKATMTQFTYSNNFSNKTMLSATLFWRHNQNDIQPYINYYDTYQIGDSIYNNVSLSTYQNIGYEDQYGMNMFGSAAPFKGMTIRGNITLLEKHIVNQFPPQNVINNLEYRINFNADYQITKTMMVEGFGSFRSARYEVQGRFPSFTNYTFAIRKQIWKDKGSLAFNMTNPFANDISQRVKQKGTNFNLNQLRQIPFRSFGITFTYKFGGLRLGDKKKDDEDNTPATMDIGGSNS